MHRSSLIRGRRWSVAALIGLAITIGAVGPALAALPKVPDGFAIRLVAAVPAVQYPCQVATALDGSMFVGEEVDGRVVTGIVRTESDAAVEIQDSEAKLVRLAKGQIDERKPSEVSLMPNGLAKGLSPQDFADLIAFLETLKNTK